MINWFLVFCTSRHKLRVPTRHKKKCSCFKTGLSDFKQQNHMKRHNFCKKNISDSHCFNNFIKCSERWTEINKSKVLNLTLRYLTVQNLTFQNLTFQTLLRGKWLIFGQSGSSSLYKWLCHPVCPPVTVSFWRGFESSHWV